MCDTFRPLYPTKAALELDDSNYPLSWEQHGSAAAAKANGKKVNTWD
jgi:hypothetical protein